MSPDRVPAGYCPDCEHLLGNDDVVRIVGRHMDGVDPTFRCPVCDADLSHPSRAPDDAGFYASRSGHSMGSPGSAGGSASPGSDDRPGASDENGPRTIAEQRPPLGLDGVREGDRITVHFDRPGMEAVQTKAGDVTDVRRSIGGSPSLVRFETDTRRRCAIDVGPDATITEAGEHLGSVVAVVVTRS